jgi:hypothetical protein
MSLAERPGHLPPTALDKAPLNLSAAEAAQACYRLGIVRMILVALSSRYLCTLEQCRHHA